MIALSDRNITLLALPIAVMSVVPSMCATQNWLAVALSDCSRLAPSSGSENMIRVLVIGPSTSFGLMRPPWPPRNSPGGPPPMPGRVGPG